MPTRAPRLCPRCRQLITGGRCAACAPSWGTSTRGGSTRAWRRLRLVVFREQGWLCNVDDCDALSVELDHIVSRANGGGDERSNLQGLCVEHHRAKTQQEAQDAKTRPR